MEDTKKIFWWSFAGTLFLIFGGSIIHFAYELSGYNPFVGLLASVNESVWEHLKLGFTSLFIFSLVEYWFVRKKVNNYIIAKAAGILILQLFIIVFFYGYNFFIEENLFLDILSYIIGCILCQVVAYKICTTQKLSKILSVISTLFLFGQLFVLMCFTYYPPKLNIFLEEDSGRYGTEWGYEREEYHEH